MISLGMRSGGGYGDIMEPLNINDTEGNLVGWYAKWIIELSFFVFLNIISLNIIFGIIIDTFAELRDDETARDKDRENICFVCGFVKKDYE
jgi:Ion transport protein